MKVCFFGNYLRDYPRNQILMDGLRQNGVEVLECHTRERGFKKFFSLYFQHRRIKNNYDIIFVAFSGHSLVWFARCISSKPLFFDAFVSLYLTNIEDRKLYSSKSLRAKYYSFLDLDCFNCCIHLSRSRFLRSEAKKGN